MTDTSTWAGLPDVKTDDGAADLLASGCEEAARLIREQCSGRRTLTADAMRDFEGAFPRIFQDNQSTANGDGENIATALEDVARQVRYITSIVPAESARRREAREWKERRDKDKSEITLSDLGGDEAPPEGPTSPPAPKVLSADATGRDTPQPGSGLNADFTAGFDWGTGEPCGVDGSGVYAALRLYNQLNEQDKTWVGTVAAAFERAGSQRRAG